MSNPQRFKRRCYVCGEILPNRMTHRYGDRYGGCHAKCAREEIARQNAYLVAAAPDLLAACQAARVALAAVLRGKFPGSEIQVTLDRTLFLAAGVKWDGAK